MCFNAAPRRKASHGLVPCLHPSQENFQKFWNLGQPGFCWGWFADLRLLSGPPHTSPRERPGHPFIHLAGNM